MAVATLSAPIIQLVSIYCDYSMRTIGFFARLLGDAIFLAAVGTMKNSWRASSPESGKTALVQSGVFHWNRNPAFNDIEFRYVYVWFELRLSKSSLSTK